MHDRAMKKRANWRRALCLTLTIGAVAFWLVPPSTLVEAHARLLRSTPAAGEALAAPPHQMRLQFSEAIDPQFSRAELLTAEGRPHGTATITVDSADRSVAIIDLGDSAQIGRGSFVLVWRVLSATDGHVTTGALPFSVGTGQIATATSAVLPTVRPPWWRVAARWLELTSLLVVAGGFAFGFFVARTVWQTSIATPTMARWWKRVWWSSAGVAFAGLAITLVDQGYAATGSSLTDPPSITVYRHILINSTFGTAWLVRLAMLVGLCPIARAIGDGRSREAIAWIAGLVLSLLLLLMVPLAGHAAGESERAFAIIMDWLHLVAASVWLGGLVFVLAALVAVSRDSKTDAGFAASGLVARFSRLALVAFGVLIVTGVANAAFHVSGPRALRDQDYGRVIIAKHAVVLVVLVGAAVNLLVNRPRLAALARSGKLAALRRQLSATAIVVAVELVAGTVATVAAGALTELPPADAPLTVDVAAKTVTIDQRATAGGLEVWLIGRLTGDPGDRFTITVTPPAGELLDADTRVIVESTLPPVSGADELIRDRFDAERLPGSPPTYAFPAARLGLAGRWDVRVIVRRAGRDDVATALVVDTSGAGVMPPRLVADNWRLPRLTAAAWALFVLAAVTAVGGVVGIRRLPGLEPFAAGLLLTMIALIATGFAVSAARQTIPVSDDTGLVNPLSSDIGSVKRGAAIYAATCVVCHGADGAGIPDPNAAHAHSGGDLTDRRSSGQRDGDLFHAVTYGVPGSAMPAYDSALTESERWDLVNYVRALQRTSDVSLVTTGTDDATP